MRKRDIIVSLVTLVSSLGLSSGTCNYTIPGSNILVPDTEQLDQAGLTEPQPEPPRIIDEVLVADQSGFTSVHLSPGLISAISYPSILRCGVSDWDNKPGEILYTGSNWESNLSILQFSRLREFANYQINELKLRLVLADSLQNNRQFRVNMYILAEPFLQEYLNSGNKPSSYQVISGGNSDFAYTFTAPQTQPGAVIEFDLSKVVFRKDDVEKPLVQNLEDVFGFGLYEGSRDPSLDDYENYRTFVRQGENAPKLIIRGQTTSNL